uniref:Uncharacterized protein n=1 Tax=Oryza punctata TaxID=4537 RepID=A0A0E0LRQ0_ORYPU
MVCAGAGLADDGALGRQLGREGGGATVIDWIPGMPPIKLGDMSSFVRTTKPNDLGLRFNEREANNCTKANALILNTFDNLEADVLAALRAEYPRIYTIGPLGTLLNHATANGEDAIGGLSLWKQDTECLAWLDTQQPRSVVYVNLGSLTVMTRERLAEFAYVGNRGDRLENLVPGGPAALPPEFRVRRGDGRPTVPSDMVPRHPAVGCFLTHSRWNSKCESDRAWPPACRWCAVQCSPTSTPTASMPARHGGVDAEVRREQVAGHLAMESEEMRWSAGRWMSKSEEVARSSGSSYENLQSMVAALITSSDDELNVKNIEL